jgi:hypothetical protein
VSVCFLLKLSFLKNYLKKNIKLIFFYIFDIGIKNNFLNIILFKGFLVVFEIILHLIF